MGLPLLLTGGGDDRPGVRRPDYQQDNPSADDAARCNLIFFNATVLALTVNIVSSLMQPDR